MLYVIADNIHKDKNPYLIKESHRFYATNNSDKAKGHIAAYASKRAEPYIKNMTREEIHSYLQEAFRNPDKIVIPESDYGNYRIHLLRQNIPVEKGETVYLVVGGFGTQISEFYASVNKDEAKKKFEELYHRFGNGGPLDDDYFTDGKSYENFPYTFDGCIIECVCD